jgi:hypothetical protein
MSEDESPNVGKPGGDGVPIYKVALVRERTLIESSRACVRKSSEAADRVGSTQIRLPTAQQRVAAYNDSRAPCRFRVRVLGVCHLSELATLVALVPNEDKRPIYADASER